MKCKEAAICKSKWNYIQLSDMIAPEETRNKNINLGPFILVMEL
jgi:hypothetical protein